MFEVINGGCEVNMCLNNNPTEVKKLLRRKSIKFIGYKIIYKPNYGEIYTPHRYTNFKPGEFKSDSKQTKICLKKRYIYKGIHVFRTLKDAKKYIKNNWWFASHHKIIKVTALKEDLLGANETQMVFRKIYTSEKKYKKLIVS